MCKTSNNKPSTRELLDVEDDDARQGRIRSLLEHTDAAVAAPRPRPLPTLPPSRPHPVPLSDLISRAEAFLPRLAASNADLARRAMLDPTSVDIEYLGGNSDSTHIEMNLGLGVFEQRPRPGRRSDTLQGDASGSSPESSSDSENDESSEDDSEDSEGDEDTPNATETVKKPDIVVLNSDTNDSGG